MPRYTKKPYQVGDWWLGKKPPSPAWHRCRYDPVTEQTERVSLGTPDFPEACAQLDAWFIDNHRPQNERLDRISLARVLKRYYDDHASKIKSEEAARLASLILLDHFGSAALSEITLQAQREFHAAMQTAGRSASYIQRIVTTAKAAINHAYRNGEIERTIPILSVPVGVAAPKGRPLSIDEMRALLDAVVAEHLRRFVVILLATACRPSAALDLSGEQCDFEHRLIVLNPEGHFQTKKYRPTVKMSGFFADIFVGKINVNLVSGNTEPYASIKTAWRATRARAGLDADVQPYSIRHTLARELRARGVDQWEVAAQLGHKTPGLAMTERYAPYDPRYLVGAVTAIQDYYDALQK